MDHNSIRHKLSEYIDDAISPEEKTGIEEHLQTCGKCRDALRELQRTVEQVRQLDEIEPPAWMTQKIMAKVRTEAEQKKSFSERLYSVFVVNLPVKAVAVVFLAAIAFYMYRDIRPQKLSEAPLQKSAVKKEAPLSGMAKNDQNRPEDSLLRSKRFPQAPEYKALDMKPEYEKPAAPTLEGKTASPAAAPAQPTEQLMPGKEEALMESRAGAPKTGAQAMVQEQITGAAPQAEAKLKSAATAQRALKAKAAAKAGPAIILQVKDVEAAAREVEQVITRFGGSILGEENPEAKKIYTVMINVQKLQDLKAKLKLIGEIEDKAGEPGAQNSMIELRIELEVKSNQPQ